MARQTPLCGRLHSTLRVQTDPHFLLFAQESTMLKYAIIFALISLVAGVLGFGGMAAGAAGIAKILFGLFLVVAVIFVVLAALGVGAANKLMK